MQLYLTVFYNENSVNDDNHSEDVEEYENEHQISRSVSDFSNGDQFPNIQVNVCGIREVTIIYRNPFNKSALSVYTGKLLPMQWRS